MEPNFIIIPCADPLSLLWKAFPELRSELDDGDSGPYYIYGRFADRLSSHSNDSQLWQRAYAFFDDLAAGGGELTELLVVGIFERLCEVPALVDRLKQNLGAAARKMLEELHTA
jgi:hypothetical protein